VGVKAAAAAPNPNNPSTDRRETFRLIAERVAFIVRFLWLKFRCCESRSKDRLVSCLKCCIKRVALLIAYCAT
jgi:hypothetical protein